MMIRTSLATAAIAALAIAGCGGSDSSSSDSTTTAAPPATQSAPAPPSTASGGASADAGATVDKVTIKDFKYGPPSITVKTGAKVTWTNEDSAPHTATVKGGFDTDSISQGKSATVAMTKAGTYAYFCSFHPYMHGTIVVKG